MGQLKRFPFTQVKGLRPFLHMGPCVYTHTHTHVREVLTINYLGLSQWVITLLNSFHYYQNPSSRDGFVPNLKQHFSKHYPALSKLAERLHAGKNHYASKAHISNQISLKTRYGVPGWVTGRKGMVFQRRFNSYYFHSFEKDPGSLLWVDPRLTMIPVRYQSGSQTLRYVQSPETWLRTWIYPDPRSESPAVWNRALCF